MECLNCKKLSKQTLIGELHKYLILYFIGCNIVAYIFLFVICGAIYLFFKCLLERRRRQGHAKAGQFEDQHVPKNILVFHIVVLCLEFGLAIIVTSGYLVACSNLQATLR